MSNPMPLRDRLAAAGVTLTAEGDRLAYEGPESALTEELVAEIRRLKAGLMFAIEEERSGPLSSDTGAGELERRYPNTAILIRWFLEEGQHLVPNDPFQLTEHIEVTNPARFKKRLLYCISRGPEGFHYRRGLLARDLLWLRKLLVKSGPTLTHEAFTRSTQKKQSRVFDTSQLKIEKGVWL